jgi:hypothetical protein
MVEEAGLERSEYGLWPATEGWFVLNVRDALGTAMIVPRQERRERS